MPILVFGGTGFVGRRVVRLLAARGHRVACIQFNVAADRFAELGSRVEMRNGDVTRFDSVMQIMADTGSDRILNLAYSLGSDHAPHDATKLNVVGMDNVFEAARRCGARRVVYASSLAVSGRQTHFGERQVSETDPAFGEQQYAMHKRFNEWQAQDYIDKHGMSIVGVRPANGTGAGKVRGSVDHVRCVTDPAQGRAVTLPYADTMRAPIHVEDIAEVFVRVLLADAPRHSLYNTGGTAISLGALAGMVRAFLPDAEIGFEHQSGGKDASGTYLIDNRRLREEFQIAFPPLRQRVLQIINAVRVDGGMSPVGG